MSSMPPDREGAAAGAQRLGRPAMSGRLMRRCALQGSMIRPDMALMTASMRVAVPSLVRALSM